MAKKRYAEHAMIDLETLDTGPRAVIVSIGVAAFDKSGTTGATLRCVLNRKQQKKLGRTESASTLDWWSKQSAEARAVFKEKQEKLAAFFVSMRLFLDDNCPGDRKVWGNGADFDMVLLNTLYADCGVQPPWKFYNHRCFRTLKSILPADYAKASAAADKKLGKIVRHDALGDAIWQAEVAARLLKRIT